jgi:hypothetical protein
MAVELIAHEPAMRRGWRACARRCPPRSRACATSVDSLLSFSRSPRIDRAPTDLAGVVSRAIGTVSELASERGVAVSVHAPSALRARCDAHKIQGVVVNLVKNAIEAGKRVEVTLRTADGEAIIEVADDGPGLSAEAREHLFEPFFTTKPNGTGLGLPTSQRFIEAHGGIIEAARSAAMGGALFRLRLPLEAAEAPVANARRHLTHEAQRAGHRRREDVPHRRGGGAGRRGLRGHHRSDGAGRADGLAARAVRSGDPRSPPARHGTASPCWK